MVRKLTFTIGLVMSLLFASQASAIPVAPVDLAGVTLGDQVGDKLIDDFTNLMPPPPTTGTLENSVFFDGTNYTYVHTVTPSADNSFMFNTEFDVRGFTGVAGWNFADSSSAGGFGNQFDFQIEQIGGRLIWISTLGGSVLEWDATEPITFFFVSNRPPGTGTYNLLNLLPMEFATAESLAPVPEPGSIALFGSGLVGLYAAMRRRRSLKM